MVPIAGGGQLAPLPPPDLLAAVRSIWQIPGVSTTVSIITVIAVFALTVPYGVASAAYMSGGSFTIQNAVVVVGSILMSLLCFGLTMLLLSIYNIFMLPRPLGPLLPVIGMDRSATAAGG